MLNVRPLSSEDKCTPHCFGELHIHCSEDGATEVFHEKSYTMLFVGGVCSAGNIIGEIAAQKLERRGLVSDPWARKSVRDAGGLVYFIPYVQLVGAGVYGLAVAYTGVRSCMANRGKYEAMAVVAADVNGAKKLTGDRVVIAFEAKSKAECLKLFSEVVLPNLIESATVLEQHTGKGAEVMERLRERFGNYQGLLQASQKALSVFEDVLKKPPPDFSLSVSMTQNIEKAEQEQKSLVDQLAQLNQRLREKKERLAELNKDLEALQRVDKAQTGLLIKEAEKELEEKDGNADSV